MRVAENCPTGKTPGFPSTAHHLKTARRADARASARRRAGYRRLLDRETRNGGPDVLLSPRSEPRFESLPRARAYGRDLRRRPRYRRADQAITIKPRVARLFASVPRRVAADDDPRPVLSRRQQEPQGQPDLHHVRHISAGTPSPGISARRERHRPSPWSPVRTGAQHCRRRGRTCRRSRGRRSP